MICYAKDVYWWRTYDKRPPVGKPVLVHGGIAVMDEKQVWKSYMGDDSGRPLQWSVKYWAEIPLPPQTRPETDDA